MSGPGPPGPLPCCGGLKGGDVWLLSELRRSTADERWLRVERLVGVASSLSELVECQATEANQAQATAARPKPTNTHRLKLAAPPDSLDFASDSAFESATLLATFASSSRSRSLISSRSNFSLISALMSFRSDLISSLSICSLSLSFRLRPRPPKRALAFSTLLLSLWRAVGAVICWVGLRGGWFGGLLCKAIGR